MTMKEINDLVRVERTLDSSRSLISLCSSVVVATCILRLFLGYVLKISPFIKIWMDFFESTGKPSVRFFLART